MSIIKTMRKQDAVYWPFSSINQFGKKSVGTAVPIRVRWDDVSEEFLDGQGERQLSKALVYVDRVMALGGILMKGTTSNITDAVDIKENANAWEIRRFDEIPDIKAKQFLRIAYL